MKVFHYSNLESVEKWTWLKKVRTSDESIKDRFDLEGRSTIAIHSNGMVVTPKESPLAIFALRSPTPDEWLKHPLLPNNWQKFMDTIGPILLELDLSPKEIKKAFVIDEKALQLSDQRLSQSELATLVQTTYDDKTPLADYDGTKEFSLPSIVIFDKIPEKQIKISEQQPILEHILEESYQGKIKESYIKRIRQIPELDTWYKLKYESEILSADKR